MKVACWNCDGLDGIKQEAAINRMEATGVIAMVVVETFFRATRALPQPQGSRWRRKDAVVPAHLIHEKARRAKGGISIIFCSNFFIQTQISFQFSPTGDWVVFSTRELVIAGVYAPPALRVDAFELVLASVKLCIEQARRELPNRPVVVVGDFNAHIGPITGDNATDKRSPIFLDFSNDLGSIFLNARLAESEERWTWIQGQTRSVVDLALTLGSPFSFLKVTPPPRPTPHQMLLVTLPGPARAPVHDPERWNWSRRALAREPENIICREKLAPVFTLLAQVWKAVGQDLDSRLNNDENDDDEMEYIQGKIDCAYSRTCCQLREALSGIACWSPEDARRPVHVHRTVDWGDLNAMPDGFMTNKVKSMMESAQGQGSQDQVRPPLEAFAEFYRKLFQAGPEIPIEEFVSIRKPIAAVDEDERQAFSIDMMEYRIKRLKWRKAIGPDNFPADVLKCCPLEARNLLHHMFSTLWAHQAAPTIWNHAFMTPIPKKGHDLADVGNWRGIALQCHLKKIYELSVRDVMRKKGWLAHHVLQTGFQARTGALDSVFVVDELTRHYDNIGRPLSAVLLDIRKAYDRTARALIWRKLRARGCPGHVIGVLQSLLDRSSVIIRLDGVSSEAVRAEVGVPQGDVLSPSMFNILVDDLPHRLVEACAPFGGCPRYGGIVMPVIMYADDQTLFHFDPRAMQAMLDAAAQYAEDNLFRYNVGKSAVSLARIHSQWGPLLLGGEEVPVIESIPFLGVQMRLGMIDHGLQIATRLVQAEKATFGLEQVGALATPLLSLSRKRQLLSAFCRSRYEYGMAISRHSQPLLDKIDRVISRQVGRCIGTGRGSCSIMRLAGFAPARIRQDQLHFKMDSRMRNAKKGDGAHLLTVRIYEKAIQDPTSQINKYWRNCKVHKLAAAKMDDYREQYCRAANDPMRELSPRPSADQAERMWRAATECAMREKAWKSQERGRKLMKIQTQEWNKPHPVAYLAGQEAVELSRWMCNLTPGAKYPCANCKGEYEVSRYHILRCSHAAGLLEGAYDPEMDIRQRGRADNVMDTQIPEMVPRILRRDVIQAENDICPLPSRGRRTSRRQWKTRQKETVPVHQDFDLREKVTKMGQVLKQVRFLCREFKPNEDNDEGPDDDDDSGNAPDSQESASRASQASIEIVTNVLHQLNDHQDTNRPPPIADDDLRSQYQPHGRGHAPDSPTRPAQVSASQPRGSSSLQTARSPPTPATGPAQPRLAAVSRRRTALGPGTRSFSQPTLSAFLGAGSRAQPPLPPPDLSQAALAAPLSPSQSQLRSPASDVAMVISATSSGTIERDFATPGHRQMTSDDALDRLSGLGSGTPSTQKQSLTFSTGSGDSGQVISDGNFATSGHHRTTADDAGDRLSGLGSGTPCTQKRSLTSGIGSGESGQGRSKRSRQAGVKIARPRPTSQGRSTTTQASKRRPAKRSRVADDTPGRGHVQTSILAFCVRSQDVVGGGSIGGEPAGPPVLLPDR